MLTTFSVPFVSAFNFLHADAAGGVRFGIWGWCLDQGGYCTSKKWVPCIASFSSGRLTVALPCSLGFYYDPQIKHGLTYTLVFFPIGAPPRVVSSCASAR